jgi:hypothetical protein
VTNPARSSRQVVGDLCQRAGVQNVTVKTIPGVLLSAAGLVKPEAREFKYTAYQFERPFVLDDSVTRQHFSLDPTGWNEILDASLRPFREETSVTN